MSKLQAKRKEAKLTQRQLADAAHVSVRTLQYYEQGVLDINKASALSVYCLAQALGCSVGDLLELDGIWLAE